MSTPEDTSMSTGEFAASGEGPRALQRLKSPLRSTGVASEVLETLRRETPWINDLNNLPDAYT